MYPDKIIFFPHLKQRNLEFFSYQLPAAPPCHTNIALSTLPAYRILLLVISSSILPIKRFGIFAVFAGILLADFPETNRPENRQIIKQRKQGMGCF